jgi:lipopolysaccharide transport system permease protein
MLNILRAIWAYRGFITSSIRAEFTNRFARSKLGGLWMIIFPLVQTALFALVLSSVFAVRMTQVDHPGGYALYLLAGMLAWALFSEIVTRCQTVFIENSMLLKKLVFPRICLPLIVCGSAIVTNALLLLATLVIFLLMGHWPGGNMVFLPVLVALNIALALGLGIVLGVLNVFIRDIGHVVGIGLQVLFWLTPIVYLPSTLPERFQPILRLNPIAPIVQGYQNVLAFDTAPPWQPLLLVAGGTIVLLGAALLLFRRASEEMVDVL